MGATTGTMGYGVIQVGTHDASKHTRVHRLAYELLVGPIPEGLVLDHTCRVTRCVNPAHLEPVTFKENVLRGDSMSARWARRTHCDAGHDLAEDRAAGRKRCRLCQNEWHLKRYHARKRGD